MFKVFARHPFSLIILCTGMAMGLVGIHSYLIFALWEAAGWPLSSTKFQLGLSIVSAGLILGIIIISLTLIMLRSHRRSSEESRKPVKLYSIVIIILSILAGIATIYYGVLSLQNILAFPEYAAYFVGRTVCLWAAGFALFLNILGCFHVYKF